MDSSAGCRCGEAPWNRFLLALIGAAGVRAAACRCRAAYAAAERPRLQQVEQRISFYAVVGHTARGCAARLTGNSQAAEQPVNAMACGFSRSIGLRARQIRDSGPVRLWSCSVKSEPAPVLPFSTPFSQSPTASRRHCHLPVLRKSSRHCIHSCLFWPVPVGGFYARRVRVVFGLVAGSLAGPNNSFNRTPLRGTG